MNWFGPSGDCGCCGGPCTADGCVDENYFWGVKICNLTHFSSAISLADADNAAFFTALDGLFVSMGQSSPDINGDWSLTVNNIIPGSYIIRSGTGIKDDYLISNVQMQLRSVRNPSNVCERAMTCELLFESVRNSLVGTCSPLTFSNASLVTSSSGSTYGPSLCYVPDPALTEEAANHRTVSRVPGLCVSVNVDRFIDTIELKIVSGASSVSDPGC